MRHQSESPFRTVVLLQHLVKKPALQDQKSTFMELSRQLPCNTAYVLQSHWVEPHQRVKQAKVFLALSPIWLTYDRLSTAFAQARIISVSSELRYTPIESC